MKKKQILQYILIAAIIIFVILSDIVLKGAKDGVLLWYNSLLPLLLPTMFLSSLLISCGTKSTILLCFLCGYPTGAFIISQMEKNRIISRTDANRLLPVCNNLSPMFMQNYIGIKCLKLKHPYSVLLIVFSSCGIYYILTKLLSHKTDYNDKHIENASKSIDASKPDIFSIINEAMSSSIIAILKVLVVVVIFSIFCELLNNIAFIPNGIKLIVMLALEITTGAKMACETQIFNSLTMPVIIAFSCFGGLSAMIQSFTVTEQHYDIKKYIYGKALMGTIAFILSCLTVYVLKIK